MSAISKRRVGFRVFTWAAVALAALFGVLTFLRLFFMGAALENTSHVGSLELYALHYYAAHPDAVNALRCYRKAPREGKAVFYAPFHSMGERVAPPHPFDCILPADHEKFFSWCPTIARLWGLCVAAQYPTVALELPGFEVGLRSFLKQPCDVDEPTLGAMFRSIYLPNAIVNPIRSSRHALCHMRRPVVVYFSNEEGRELRSIWHVPSRE